MTGAPAHGFRDARRPRRPAPNASGGAREETAPRDGFLDLSLDGWRGTGWRRVPCRSSSIAGGAAPLTSADPGARERCLVTPARGEVLRSGAIPCRTEWRFLPDPELERWPGAIPMREPDDAMRSVLLCPRCGRLRVPWNGFSARPAGYEPVPDGDPRPDVRNDAPEGI